ncbi:MAG: hypothetical protein AB1716_05615 [Planctomycetota bacterium]
MRRTLRSLSRRVGRLAAGRRGIDPDEVERDVLLMHLTIGGGTPGPDGRYVNGWAEPHTFDELLAMTPEQFSELAPAYFGIHHETPSEQVARLTGAAS